MLNRDYVTCGPYLGQQTRKSLTEISVRMGSSLLKGIVAQWLIFFPKAVG